MVLLDKGFQVPLQMNNWETTHKDRLIVPFPRGQLDV